MVYPTLSEEHCGESGRESTREHALATAAQPADEDERRPARPPDIGFGEAKVAACFPASAGPLWSKDFGLENLDALYLPADSSPIALERRQGRRQLEFPENREFIREIFEFRAIWAIGGAKMRSLLKRLQTNSLHFPNREFALPEQGNRVPGSGNNGEIPAGAPTTADATRRGPA